MTKRPHVEPELTTEEPEKPDLAALWRQHEDEQVASDAIYATLREAILSGVLRAGERLAELQLAAMFDRSRTPVREAILRLESEQLAERSPRRGFLVRAISREEILELYAVREVLDGLAARLAAQACQPRDLDHIKWINQRLEKATEERNLRLMVDINLEFHMAVAQAGHNELLMQFTRQIHDWERRFSVSTFSYPGRIEQAAEEHRLLLEALTRRDPDEAERVARIHMVNAAQVRVAIQQSAERLP